MSLDDFKQIGGEFSPDTTLGELMDVYGEGRVVRGIAYIQSLSEAEDAYRDSLDDAEYAEEYAESLTGSRAEGEAAEEMNEKWASRSKESGLGVDDE